MSQAGYLLIGYLYSDNLLDLEQRSSQDSVALPEALQIISTPLHYWAWEKLLEDHPDQRFMYYILTGRV